MKKNRKSTYPLFAALGSAFLLGCLFLAVVLLRSEQPEVEADPQRDLLIELAEVVEAERAESRQSESVDTEDSESSHGVETNRDDQDTEELLDLLSVAVRELAPKVQNFVIMHPRYTETRERTRRFFDREELPLLLAMLLDDTYRPLWGTLARVVVFFDEPELTVPVLIDYIKRDVKYEAHESSEFIGKAHSLAWLGLYGGEEVDALLRQCLTHEGAQEVGKDFLRYSLPSPFQSEMDFVRQMQSYASFGLVYTQDADNVRLVETLHQELLPVVNDLYLKDGRNELFTNTERDTMSLFELVAEALATRDIIDRIGFEAFRPVALDGFASPAQVQKEGLIKYGVQFH